MKYKTFRALALGGVVVAGTGIFAAVGGFDESEPTSVDTQPPGIVRPQQPVLPQQTPIVPRGTSTGTPQGTTSNLTGQQTTTESTGTPTNPDNQALRSMDRDIIAIIARGISGDKLKDAFENRTYKVNVYRDEGQPGVNRVKIDLDRDERWDEKWTIEWANGEYFIHRQVSPTDDDSTYSVEYDLVGEVWIPR